MIDLLCTINDKVKLAKLEHQTALKSSKVSALELQFQKIIDLGYKDNPEPVLEPDAPKTLGLIYLTHRANFHPPQSALAKGGSPEI
jgi:hypothetical protein